MQRKAVAAGKDGSGAAAPPQQQRPSGTNLFFCFISLQVAYLTWGVLQEKVMTTEYPSGRFPSSVFCVLANRTLAVLLAGALSRFYYSRLLPDGCSPLSFAWCALSNVVSSTSQYEALRYADFPLQVLSKSTKVIPVMTMGKVLNGKTYSVAEYVEAVVISAGVVLFALSEPKERRNTTTEAIGVLLLVCYVVTDSFTSQWQSKLFSRHKSAKPAANLHSHQMMFWVNVWSIVQTLSVLVARGELLTCIAFLSENPQAAVHVLMNGVASAVGQVVIYYTIRVHGPIVFTTIMVTRQMLGMFVSCILFSHPFTGGMGAGAAMVFAAVFYGIRRKLSA